MITYRAFRDGICYDPIDRTRAAALMASDEPEILWLDVVDPDAGEMAGLAELLGLHPLAVEDVLHRNQRPKVELYTDHVFVVVQPVELNDGAEVGTTDVFAFAGKRYLATVRSGSRWPMDGVLTRWQRRADLAPQGVGFLLYVLIDAVVDGYLGLVERMEIEVDELEDQVFAEHERERGVREAAAASAQIQQRLFRAKRAVITLHRAVTPMREALELLQDRLEYVTAPLQPYFRDVTDHVLRTIELTDNVRDLLTSLLEIRVAQQANRLNVVMKGLTAWGAIILVPTLIAGVYGMNFRAMPELRWQLGYPLALGMMAAAAGALYLVFKRRGWL